MSEPHSESDPALLPSSSEVTSTDPVLLPIGGNPVSVPDSSEAATAPTEEGLPEWEPLTPELVEDEAVRGDFVLRWAVVLLALLIGCRQLVDTEILLQVKTGQYLAAHGWWPPATDVFSATATGQRWVNLSWLWDLVSAGAFSVGEGIGLSIATALLVALTWWLLGQISRAGISDWFGSILGVLSLLACQHQFSGRSETLTLLGIGLTLFVWHRWRGELSEGSESSVPADRAMSLWWLVPIFLVWSNVDPRMFLGLAVLLLWGLGDWIGLSFGRSAMSSAQRQLFWKVWCSCLAITFLNPFGWHSLRSPIVLYGTEYPAWQQYLVGVTRVEETAPFALYRPVVWQTIWQPLVTGVVVLLAAVVTLLLNFRRANFADVVLLLGMSLLACVASHELAAASLVACAIGGLNAQQWYRENFRQSYSIEFRELLFTRGGRAITVAVFFLLAFLAVNQRLFGPQGRRVGLGLSADLTTLIDGYREATAKSFDDRPFNLVPMQGDLLIWLNQKPFIDSRLALYGGSGESNLLVVHEQTRRALATDQPATGEADWRRVFDQYQITHVMPRLLGARPVTYFRLLTSSQWRLTSVGPVCAVLYRTDSGNTALQDYLAEHRLNFVKLAMQSDTPAASPRTDWPRPPTTYQRYISSREQRLNAPVLEAAQWLMHLQAWANGQLQFDPANTHPNAVALAYLAIRKANQGLAESPDQAAGYRVLADAYLFLEELEAPLVQQAGAPFVNSLRFYQALGALYQTLQLEPQDLQTRRRLIAILERHGRIDLALRELREVERRTGAVDPDDPDEEQLQRQQIQRQERWESQSETLREQIGKATEAGESKSKLAAHVYQAGFVLEALQLLDSNLQEVRESPELQVMRGLLLFESGQLETAYRQFEYESDNNRAAWRIPAAWTHLAHGEYDRALSLWSKQRQVSLETGLNGLLATLPLIQSPLALMGSEPWPLIHLNVVADRVTRGAEEDAMLLFYSAMGQLEAGQTRVAGKTLAGLLESNPETQLRPLIRFYVFLITDKLLDAEPPSEWIPIEKEMFAPDEAE